MPEEELITAKEVMEIFGFSAGELDGFTRREVAPKSITILSKENSPIRHWPKTELLDYIKSSRCFDMMAAQILLKNLAQLNRRMQQNG